MVEAVFNIPGSVLDRIVQAIDVVARPWAHASPGESDLDVAHPPVWPVPSRAALERLLVVLLQASQAPDEGRFPEVNVIVVDRSASRPSLLIELHLPKDLSANALAKLAMCVTHGTGALVVDSAAEQIWALAELPAGGNDRSFFPFLTFQIKRPGAVVVRYGGRECMRITDLECRFLAPVHFDEVAASTLISKAIGNDHLPFGERLRVATVLLRVATEMQARGHGGTLLVASTKHALISPFKYPVLISALRDSLEGLGVGPLYAMSNEGAAPHILDARTTREETHRGAVRQVASLTQTDGAVLLTPELDVRGFGCFVKASEADPVDVQVTELDGFDPSLAASAAKIPAQRIGGARHQSAIAFVNANPESIALAASQDGVLTMVVPTTDYGIVVIRPILPH